MREWISNSFRGLAGGPARRKHPDCDLQDEPTFKTEPTPESGLPAPTGNDQFSLSAPVICDWKGRTSAVAFPGSGPQRILCGSWHAIANSPFLKKCAYLIVRFGVEGAILCQFTADDFKARLFYDPKVGENGFKDLYPGRMLGLGNVFTAAFAAALAPKALEGVKRS